MNRFEDLLNRFSGLLNRFEGEGPSHPLSENVSTTPSKSPSTSSTGPAKREHKILNEFDRVMNASLDKFIELGNKHENKKIGEVSLYIKEMFQLIRNIIQAVTESKKESTENMAVLITPLVKNLDTKIGKYSKDSKIRNH